MSCKTVFLDRDGTINVDHGYVHRADQWQFDEGAIDALRLLSDAGYRIAVVTNQSGIAKGLYVEDDVIRLHKYVRERLSEAGAIVDAFAFCPHDEEGSCRCRKPRVGMLGQVVDQLGEPVDLSASWTVGDKPSDIEFGHALGMRTALLRSSYWRLDSLGLLPDLIVDSCYEAATKIASEGL